MPGMTGERVWRFTKAGTYDFACLVPGHFEAGMVGKVRVGRRRTGVLIIARNNISGGSAK
ncbi:MAG: hypothetical protein OHK0028_10350 [Deltaproteobacteria bacterium]